MLVTVYIPTKNRLSSLKKAVDSVLSQSYSDIELIVVNDGSSDQTSPYLAQVANRDRRVSTIDHPQSRGAPASRNEAITRATGLFVTGLDDDDTFEPTRVEAFVKGWELAQSCGAKTSLLYSQENWIVDGALKSTTRKCGSTDVGEMITSNNIGNQVFAPRHVYIASGLFDVDLPAWQDLEFFIRILKRFGTGRLVDVPTYNFDVSVRPDRISSLQDKVGRACSLVCEKHFADSPRAQQLLMLQMFSAYYSFRPNIDDVFRFSRLGWWPAGLLRMIRAHYGVFRFG